MPSGWCGGAKRSSILATVMMSLASSHPERRSGSCRCRPGRASEVLKSAHQESQRRLASNRGRSHLLEVPGSPVAGCCIPNWRYATTRIKSTLLLAGGEARVASASGNARPIFLGMRVWSYRSRRVNRGQGPPRCRSGSAAWAGRGQRPGEVREEYCEHPIELAAEIDLPERGYDQDKNPAARARCFAMFAGSR